MNQKSEEALYECARQYEEFLGIVARMRDAQKTAERAMAESDDYSEALIYINKTEELEKQVDKWLEINL